MQSLPSGYRALVIGASGGIGAAIVQHLEQDEHCARVYALSRSSQPAVDYDNESSIADAAKQLQQDGPLHLIIVATGMLHDSHGMPEKRLAQLNCDQMLASFRTNTMGPALVLAKFIPLLAQRERSLLGVLSAKVGSIGDNRLGGWYSYRASKAALNMLLKTASIEISRTHPNTILAALHPGTVDTGLSAPFKGAQIGRSPDLAARDLLQVMDGLQPSESGGFWAYDGKPLPW